MHSKRTSTRKKTNVKKQDIDISISKLELHKKAELFESRINDAKEGYESFHPSLSSKMASNTLTPPRKKQGMSEDEKMRYDNYEQHVPVTKIPPFWEPRPWDKEENKMTEDEGKEIQFKIYKWNKTPSKSNFTFHPYKKGAICPHFDEPETIASGDQIHSVRLSVKDHFTDDYDTDTDIL